MDAPTLPQDISNILKGLFPPLVASEIIKVLPMTPSYTKY